MVRLRGRPSASMLESCPRFFFACLSRMHPTPLSSFKLALAQIRVESGKLEANLACAIRQITLAARRGAQLVLLPETFDLGWTYPDGRHRAEPIPGGRACEALRAVARQHRLHICAGLTERDGHAVYNAAVLLSPDGEVLLKHRKLNELAIAHFLYDQGDRLGVADTAFGTIGLMICADAQAPGECVLRTLAGMGADLILSPCAWAVPPGYDNGRKPYGDEWRSSFGTVARDYRVWIAGCSNVGRITGGPWHGHDCIGCSLVVGPSGQPELSGPYGSGAETLLEIDVQFANSSKRRTGWPARSGILSPGTGLE